jgi:hypothetical protein
MQKDITTQKNSVQEFKEKDTKQSLNVKGQIFTSQKGVVLFERSRKIATALYAVSDLFSDDVLKNSVREQSLLLLSNMTFTGDVNVSKSADPVSEVLRTVVFIQSQLQLASDTSQLSSMNANILFEQMNQFADELRSFQLARDTRSSNIIGKNNVLNSSYFDTDALEDFDSDETLPRQTTGSFRAPSQSYETTSRPIEKKNPVSQRSEPTKIILKTSSKNDDLKTKRHSSIVAFLRDNSNVPINDIVDFVGDVSSKTIQRDLNELIDRGVVVKEGSRRWSTYKLG